MGAVSGLWLCTAPYAPSCEANKLRLHLFKAKDDHGVD